MWGSAEIDADGTVSLSDESTIALTAIFRKRFLRISPFLSILSILYVNYVMSTVQTNKETEPSGRLRFKGYSV